MMLENDYLKRTDILGTGASIIADGSIIDHTKITLREIEIGGLVLRNVEAVVIHNQDSPLLLGLSAIRRLGKVSITGNNLIIDSYSAPNLNKEYSLDELSQMYQKALDYHSKGSYLLAAEQFDILYQNDYLLPYDIGMYANCLYAIHRDQEALDMFLSIEDWTEKNDPENLGLFYEGICGSAFGAEQYLTSIRYGELSLTHLNVSDKAYYLATSWMALSYQALGDQYTAKDIYEKYLMKYFATHGISATDCWSKNYKDESIARAYRSIGFLYDTYGEAKKYIIIAAAWGHSEAIERCKEFGWDYSSKPYEYVY